jgi:hypothetical protein
MKKILSISLVLLGLLETNAGVIGDFFGQNPTNTWDVSTYALNNLTSSKLDVSKGWGGGIRTGYWLTPSVGAALDLSYCDQSWTFATIGLTARGTINLGAIGSVSPYAVAGPGYTFTRSGTGQTINQELVAKAGAGAVVHLSFLKWADLFGEYSYTTTSPKEQELVIFGFTKRF